MYVGLEFLVASIHSLILRHQWWTHISSAVNILETEVHILFESHKFYLQISNQYLLWAEVKILCNQWKLIWERSNILRIMWNTVPKELFSLSAEMVCLDLGSSSVKSLPFWTACSRIVLEVKHFHKHWVYGYKSSQFCHFFCDQCWIHYTWHRWTVLPVSKQLRHSADSGWVFSRDMLLYVTG